MIRASQILFWSGMTFIASIALYHTSDRSYDLNRQLRTINNTIEAEEQKVHVLKAEWVYLANPARVETFVKRHMTELRPTATRQVIGMSDFDEALPFLTDEQKKTAALAPPPEVQTKLTAIEPSEEETQVQEAKPTSEAKPVQEAKPAPEAEKESIPVPQSKPSLHKFAVAAPPTQPAHVNERMLLQRVAKKDSPDKIGALIAELGGHQ